MSLRDTSRLVSLAVLMVIWMCRTDAMAEPIYYPPNKAPAVSLEHKAVKSVEAASAVVRGKLEWNPHQPQAFSQTEGFYKVKFTITDVLKGTPSLRGRSIELSLPVLLAPSKPSAKGLTSEEVAAAAEKLTMAERNYESGSLDEGAYKQEQQRQIERLLQSTSYLQEFLIVPVKPGGLDTTHRNADVILRPAQSYVVMTTKSLAADVVDPIFPWELDVYDAADPKQLSAVRKALDAR